MFGEDRIGGGGGGGGSRQRPWGPNGAGGGAERATRDPRSGCGALRSCGFDLSAPRPAVGRAALPCPLPSPQFPSKQRHFPARGGGGRALIGSGWGGSSPTCAAMECPCPAVTPPRCAMGPEVARGVVASPPPPRGAHLKRRRRRSCTAHHGGVRGRAVPGGVAAPGGRMAAVSAEQRGENGAGGAKGVGVQEDGGGGSTELWLRTELQ